MALMRMRNCQPGCVREGSHSAPLECQHSHTVLSAYRDFVGAQTNTREQNERIARAMMHEIEREEDPTRAPAHYVATQRANGIEPGAEMLDWICATRGRDAAINYLRVEMLTKVQRLGLRSQEAELRDVYKIEQACAKLRGLILGGSDDGA